MGWTVEVPPFWIALSWYNASFKLRIQGLFISRRSAPKNDFQTDLMIHEGASTLRVVNAELLGVPGRASDWTGALTSWKLWGPKTTRVLAYPNPRLVPADRVSPVHLGNGPAWKSALAFFLSSANWIAEPLKMLFSPYFYTLIHPIVLQNVTFFPCYFWSFISCV